MAKTKKAKAQKKASTPEIEPREPTAAALADPVAGILLQSLAVADLVAWPGLNPRGRFDLAGMQELTDSVAAVGVKEPLGVRLNPTAPHYVFKGERRLRAAIAAGLTHVPATVRELDEAEAFTLALIENAARSDLTALEEARAIRKYSEFHPGVKQEEIGEVFGGRGAPWVSNRLRLLELPPAGQALLEDGLIQASSARDHLLALCRIPDDFADAREKLFDEIAAKVKKAITTNGEAPLQDPEVEELVADAVTDAFPPLVTPSQYQDRSSYDGPGNIERYAWVTVAAYKKAGLPIFETSNRHQLRVALAVDVAGWKKLQKEAHGAAMAAAAERKRKKKPKAKGALELLAKHEPGKVIDLAAGTDKAQILKKAAVKLCQVGAGKVRETELQVLDPRGLPREQLFLVKEYYGHFLAFIGDDDQVTAAEQRAEKAIAQSIRNRRLARGKPDAAEVDVRSGVQAVPDLVALIAGLGRYTGKGDDPVVVLATLQDLGVELDRWTTPGRPLADILGRDEAEGPAEPWEPLEGDELVAAVLMDMPPSKVEQLARVLALRITRGDFDGWKKNQYSDIKDPLEVEARRKWMETQDRLTRELITFDLPEKLKGKATIVADEDELTCRVCGCTEYSPCAKGCSWDEKNSGDDDDMICTACVAKGQLQPVAPAVSQEDMLATEAWMKTQDQIDGAISELLGDEPLGITAAETLREQAEREKQWKPTPAVAET